MKPLRSSTVLLLIILTFFARSAAAQVVIQKFPAIEGTDRVLVLAPHPDDEAIGTGGIIGRALSLPVPVKVVYLTNGDHNEIAFIVYKKGLMLRQKSFLQMGEVRRQEAVRAMTALGLNKNDLVF